MKYVMIMFCKQSLYIYLLKWHCKVVHVSIVKLMICHILIDKPNQVHKHNHQYVSEELKFCIYFEKE